VQQVHRVCGLLLGRNQDAVGGTAAYSFGSLSCRSAVTPSAADTPTDVVERISGLAQSLHQRRGAITEPAQTEEQPAARVVHTHSNVRGRRML
jgi:hypothetical protein